MINKTCFKCGATKPLDDFYRHPMMRDGHLNKCKECNKVDSSMRDPAKVKAYDRARAKNPARRAASLEAQKRRRAANPAKRYAHSKLSRAVKSGAIVKPKICQVCLNELRLVGHHEDYSKPLDVIWMCDPCHKRYHMSAAEKYPTADDPTAPF